MNRKQYNPVNRSQRLIAIVAATMMAGLLFDGVASISAQYDSKAPVLAAHAQPTQVAQASMERDQALR